jgi:hypothetical protein
MKKEKKEKVFTIRSEVFGGHKIWRIYKNGEWYDFYWKKTETEHGLTRKNVEEIIKPLNLKFQ